MSNLPALPGQQDLAAVLRQSFPTLAESLTSDEALPYVPPHVASRALGVVRPVCEPADHDDLTFALGWLASVTTGDKARSPETMQVSARALVEALRDYPAGAALEAIREWPKTENGKWWPTENELRREAEARSWRTTRLFTHLRAATNRPDAASPRTNEPGVALEPYLREVEEIHGVGFIKSYLSPLTCQYQGKTIWTHQFAVERLRERTGRLLEKHDVLAISDRAAADHFRNSTAHFDEMKPRRRA